MSNPNPQPAQDDASRLQALMGGPTAPVQAAKPQPSSSPASAQNGDAARLQTLVQSDQATANQPAPSRQSNYSLLRDLTGSSAEEWKQWNDQKKKEFLDHPITSMIKNLGSFAWGAAKAVDEFDPISIQRTKQLYEDTKEHFEAYRQARKEGKSFTDSLQAAQDASMKSNPLQLFKAPDANSDMTEQALYDSVNATHGEGAARVAVALKRTLRSFAEDFKKDPDQAAGNISVKLLPVVLTAGAASPETAAAETESGLTEAETVANQAGNLSKLKEPSVVKKILNPEESAKTSGAIKAENAIREATGNTNPNMPVRRSFGTLAEDLKAQAKPTYQKMDELLEGRWDANKNAIDDVETGLRRESDVDKLAKLKTKKAELLTEKEQLQEEATEKGVSPQDIADANTNWRRASALKDLERQFKASVDAQDRVNLEGAIKKLKNFDRLDDALGGKENSARLISKLEQQLEQQKAMQAKYTTAKYVVGGAAGLIGMKAFWGIVDAAMGH